MLLHWLLYRAILFKFDQTMQDTFIKLLWFCWWKNRASSKHISEYKCDDKCSGVWIINGEDVFYNQYSTVTFLCPMRWGWSWLLSSKSSPIPKNHDICTFLRFERYPLDEHICKFRVGSTNMDINFMRFAFNSDWLFVSSTFMIFYSLKRMIKILLLQIEQ